MLTGNKVPPEVTEVTTQLALDLRKILGDRLCGNGKSQLEDVVPVDQSMAGIPSSRRTASVTER
jgi:hypothetical protein